jgi:hypothetical protein
MYFTVLNLLTYADDMVLIGQNDIEIQLFVEIDNITRKLGLHTKQGKTKHMIVERKNSSKQNRTINNKDYIFEIVDNFKY